LFEGATCGNRQPVVKLLDYSLIPQLGSEGTDLPDKVNFGVELSRKPSQLRSACSDWPKALHVAGFACQTKRFVKQYVGLRVAPASS
jgi:hypothetical protein